MRKKICIFGFVGLLLVFMGWQIIRWSGREEVIEMPMEETSEELTDVEMEIEPVEEPTEIVSGYEWINESVVDFDVLEMEKYGEERLISSGPLLEYWRSYQISPEGLMYIPPFSDYYLESAGKEIVLPADMEVVLEPSDNFFNFYRLSPDDRTFAYIYDDGLYLYDWQRQILVELMEFFDFGWITSPVWSPNNQTLAIAFTNSHYSEGTGVFIIDLSQGVENAVLLQEHDVYMGTILSNESVGPYEFGFFSDSQIQYGLCSNVSVDKDHPKYTDFDGECPMEMLDI